MVDTAATDLLGGGGRLKRAWWSELGGLLQVQKSAAVNENLLRLKPPPGAAGKSSKQRNV